MGVAQRSVSATLSQQLWQAVMAAARTASLLVVCEYDGTLTPGTDSDLGKRPLPEAVRALRSLAAMPATASAVISGRDLPDLAALSRLPSEVRLLGEHGAQCDGGFSRTSADNSDNSVGALRQHVSATTTVFLGSCAAGESVVSQWGGADVVVQVGQDGTVGDYRVDDASAAALVLALLLEERTSWLFGKHSPPIERLSLLSNQRSVALVTPDARLVWFCHPEPDSGAVFAELLGGPAAGHFSVRPERAGLPFGQRYLPGTMTVQTRWPRLLVTDYLAHDTVPGRTDVIRVLSGSGRAVVEFAPRPEFGEIPVRLSHVGEGLRVLGTAEPMVLRSPGVAWRITSDGVHDSARAVVPLAPEQPVVLELRCGTDALSPAANLEPRRRRQAAEHWSGWLSGLRLPHTERELVARSALTLRALCHPGGAVLAAATTSLPEEAGGVRNWDYRYCWLRDAALTVQTLLSLGSTREAEAFLDWLHAVVETLPGPERLRPLYTLHGGGLPPEAELPLPGYAGS